MNAARVARELGPPMIVTPVRVKFSSGAYVATAGHGKTSARASSTADAETAVRRAYARYLGGAKVVIWTVRCIQRIGGTGVEHWEVLVERATG